MSATGSLAARPEAPFAADAGTTLIEALAVVAITALIAVIAFPQMNQALTSLTQRQTVAVVAARLREARAQAMLRDETAVFAVASDGAGYGVTGGPIFRAPPGVSLGSKTPIPEGVAFYGDGTSSGGVVFINAGRRTMTVTVAPLSGVVGVGHA
jgi:type II secretory pathway pseudopilin PulG